MWGLNRGKATGAFTETGVVDEADVVRDTTPLEITRAAVRGVEQFIRMLGR